MGSLEGEDVLWHRWQRRVATSTFVRWEPMFKEFLQSVGLSFSEMVEWQREHPYDYRFVEAAYEWIEANPNLAIGSKKLKLSIVRSAFTSNRCPLPYEKPNFHSTRKPVECGFGGIEELRKFLLSCTPPYRAAFMVEFQSGSGRGELIHISNHHNQHIREEVRKGNHIIRLPMPGRKHSLNVLPYYTFIGDDAVACLKDMFERQGYQEKPSLFVNQYDKPLKAADLTAYFTIHAFKTGLIKPACPPCPKCGGKTNRVRSYKADQKRRVRYVCVECGSSQPSPFTAQDRGSIRYRLKTHELRDLFKTECHRSLQSGNNFDLSCSEFWMGHSIDPLLYDKIMRDRQYGVVEYRKVLPFLNILSQDPRKVDRHEVSEELERERAARKDVERRLARVEKVLLEADKAGLFDE